MEPDTLDTIEALPLDPPDELLIIANPVSANALRGKRIITDLQQAHPGANIDVFPTSPNGREVNQQRLLDFLQERVDPNNPNRKNLWIVLATGDGTIRDVAEALQHADSAIRNVPILPVAAGNGNDFTTMAHSFVGKYAPASLLDRARLQPIYPLQCTISYDSNQTQQRIGVSYISFGATAHAAEKIDKLRLPAGKKDKHNAPAEKRDVPALLRGIQRIRGIAHEKIIATQSVLATDLFEIEEDGKTYELFERIFPNGNRMAKHLRFPGKLEEDGFRDIRLESNTVLSLAVNAGRLACGLLKGQAIRGSDRVTFTTKTDTMIQLDGEAFPLKAGAHITVQTAAHPINVVRLT